MAKEPSETKRRLLKAAAQVVKQKGASQLTLEAVAKEANVSKGGLLYHYPTKSALLIAMVMHLNSTFEQAIEEQVAQGITSWLEAYVEMSFNPQGSQIAESSGMLAAIANDLSLLEPLSKRFKVLQQEVEASDLEPNLATIIRLAADGLWFTELFDISPLTEQRRTQVLAALITLIRKQGYE